MAKNTHLSASVTNTARSESNSLRSLSSTDLTSEHYHLHSSVGLGQPSTPTRQTITNYLLNNTNNTVTFDIPHLSLNDTQKNRDIFILNRYSMFSPPATQSTTTIQFMTDQNDMFQNK
jgi:hypothetical protein